MSINPTGHFLQELNEKSTTKQKIFNINVSLNQPLIDKTSINQTSDQTNIYTNFVLNFISNSVNIFFLFLGIIFNFYSKWDSLFFLYEQMRTFGILGFLKSYLIEHYYYLYLLIGNFLTLFLSLNGIMTLILFFKFIFDCFLFKCFKKTLISQIDLQAFECDEFNIVNYIYSFLFAILTNNINLISLFIGLSYYLIKIIWTLYILIQSDNFSNICYLLYDYIYENFQNYYECIQFYLYFVIVANMFFLGLVLIYLILKLSCIKKLFYFLKYDIFLYYALYWAIEFKYKRCIFYLISKNIFKSIKYIFFQLLFIIIFTPFCIWETYVYDILGLPCKNNDISQGKNLESDNTKQELEEILYLDKSTPSASPIRKSSSYSREPTYDLFYENHHLAKYGKSTSECSELNCRKGFYHVGYHNRRENENKLSKNAISIKYRGHSDSIENKINLSVPQQAENVKKTFKLEDFLPTCNNRTKHVIFEKFDSLEKALERMKNQIEGQQYRFA